MGNSDSKDSKPDNPQEQEPSPISLSLVEQAQQIAPRLHSITQNIIQYCKAKTPESIDTEIKKLTYDLPPSPLPLCLKRVDEYYRKPHSLGQIILCQSCFEADKPGNQGYIQVDSKTPEICMCGNKEMNANPPRCKTHPESSPMENQATIQLFKTQIKFLFDLLLHLKDKEEQPKIEHDTLLRMAKAILCHVNSLTKHNHTTAKLFFNILMDRPQKLEGQGGLKPLKKDYKTIFEQTLAFTEGGQELVPYVQTLLSTLMKTDIDKQMLVGLYFSLLVRADELSDTLVTMFNKKLLNPSVFPHSYHLYFSSTSSNRQLALPPLDANDSDLVISKYSALSKELNQLLGHSDSKAIFTKILQHTSLINLLNFQTYYLTNNEGKEDINQIGNYFTLLLNKIIHLLGKDEMAAANLFNKMAVDCWAQIKARGSQTFNRSFQRVFAQVIFELSGHSYPSRCQLMGIIGEIDTETISRLILHFIDFKTLFHEQYRALITTKVMKKGEHRHNIANMQLLALDQTYLKIMTNILEPHEINHLYRTYIDQKLSQLLKKSNGQVTKDNVITVLKKTAQFMQVIAVSLSSNMSELILSANSQLQSKQSFLILNNLVAILQNSDSVKFKQIVEKFIENQFVIIDFIKHETVIENKKVRSKSAEVAFPIFILPGSEYLSSDLQHQAYQKMLSRKGKIVRNQLFDAYYHEKTLEAFIPLWETSAEIVSSPEFQTKKCQKEMVMNLQTLCSLYLLNKSATLLKLIEKFSTKMQMSPPQLQAFLKVILDNPGMQEDRNQLMRNKKKKRLDAMKEKQKIALDVYKIEEDTKIDLQCIFCKNSEEGEPYLLGHFKYNNFYSKKILAMDVPFMEFTTCGHSAHQKCLRQMHKGQFRIWYPCILCKSITNMLLPWATSELSEDRRFEKILDFLKNFSATYTFFFQENKKLVQFGVNDVLGVYKMLIKTIVYSLTIYPIVNQDYFRQKQFPILKFIYDLLVFTHKRLKNIKFNDDYNFKAPNQLTDIFHYHHYQLESNIFNTYGNIALQKKIDSYRDNFSEELTELYDEIYENLSGEKEGFQCQLKENKFQDMIKGLIFKPPYDLLELRQLKKKCVSCETVSQKFEVCLLCEWTCCHSCTDVRKVHSLEEHLGESVFLNGLTGAYCYLHEGLTGDFTSVYVNYLGEEANKKKSIAEGEYTLNETKWLKIVNDIVCDRLHKEVYRLKG